MTTETKPIIIELDKNGWLVNTDAWTEEVAKHIAEREGIELTDEHWLVIRHMRKYYLSEGKVSSLRQVCREENLSKECVHNLFELDPDKAARIAGLPFQEGYYNSYWKQSG